MCLENKCLIMLLYVCEFVKFELILNKYTVMNLKRNHSVVWGGILSGIILFFCNFQDEEGYIIMYLIFLVSFIAHLDEKIVNGGLKTGLIFLVINFFDGFNRSVLALFFKVSSNVYVIYLFCGFITIVQMILLKFVYTYLSRKILSIKDNKEFRSIYICFLFSMCFILILIVYFQYLIPFTDDRFKPYNLCFTVAGYISAILTLISFIGLSRINQRINNLLEYERFQGQIQVSFYELLLEREEDTKDFRHDLNNHLICLNELAAENDLEEVRSYINKIVDIAVEINRVGYRTGNMVVDSILNHYFNQVKEFTDIFVHGNMGEECILDKVELCIVVANLVQNAVEYVEYVKKMQMIEKKSNNKYDRKYIKFQLISNFDEKFGIKVINNVDQRVEFTKRGLPLSDKYDSKRHGRGLKKTKRIVEGCGGKMIVQCTEREFSVHVSFSQAACMLASHL